MSQKKVEQYKEYKKNKTKILKREKQMRRLEFGLIGAICVVFVVWFCISIQQNIAKVSQSDDTVPAVTVTSVDMSGYADYLSNLQTSYSAS